MEGKKPNCAQRANAASALAIPRVRKSNSATASKNLKQCLLNSVLFFTEPQPRAFMESADSKESSMLQLMSVEIVLKCMLRDDFLLFDAVFWAAVQAEREEVMARSFSMKRGISLPIIVIMRLMVGTKEPRVVMSSSEPIT